MNSDVTMSDPFRLELGEHDNNWTQNVEELFLLISTAFLVFTSLIAESMEGFSLEIHLAELLENIDPIALLLLEFHLPEICVKVENGNQKVIVLILCPLKVLLNFLKSTPAGQLHGLEGKGGFCHLVDNPEHLPHRPLTNVPSEGEVRHDSILGPIFERLAGVVLNCGVRVPRGLH